MSNPIRLSVADVAAYLSTSPTKIIRLIKAGALRAIDIALPGAKRPRYVVRASDLEEFEQARLTTKPPPAAAPRRRQAEKVPNYFGSKN